MTFRARFGLSDLGVGVGARGCHYDDLLGKTPSAEVHPSWLEVISENFMGEGGLALGVLDRLREAYPVVTHGVSMSLGGTDPLDADYLRRLRRLCDRVNTPWFSDHLCFTRAHGTDLHDLLPLPMTEETIEHVASRIRRAMDAVGRPFALENVSSYLRYRADAMPEWEFLAAIAERADCGLLFDVNNVYVSSKNHDFDAERYIEAVPADRVVQIHVAGHTDKGTHILDTHGSSVAEPVWDLYRATLKRTGLVSTLVEWDEDIPPFETLMLEVEKARRVREGVLA